MTHTPWYTGTVLHGDQYGRTLGFPTINLDPNLIQHRCEPGVYAANIEVAGVSYAGALYYGPRITLHETTTVLEIHIVGIDRDIYDSSVRFRLGAFVRPPMDFSTTEALKQQLAVDIQTVKNLLHTDTESVL